MITPIVTIYHLFCERCKISLSPSRRYSRAPWWPTLALLCNFGLVVGVPRLAQVFASTLFVLFRVFWINRFEIHTLAFYIQGQLIWNQINAVLVKICLLFVLQRLAFSHFLFEEKADVTQKTHHRFEFTFWELQMKLWCSCIDNLLCNQPHVKLPAIASTTIHGGCLGKVDSSCNRWTNPVAWSTYGETLFLNVFFFACVFVIVIAWDRSTAVAIVELVLLPD